MPVYSYAGVRPRIARTAYVHPDSVIIGDVRIGPEASVWPGAVLRGDHGAIEVGARTSIQDGTVVHTTRDWPTLIGAECVIGHNAHLEGCVVGDRCLVGSMSAILNRVRIGSRCVVGAGAVVPEGLAAPDNSLLLGVPAQVRPITGDRHQARVDSGVATYVRNARTYPAAQRLERLEDCLTSEDLR